MNNKLMYAGHPDRDVPDILLQVLRGLSLQICHQILSLRVPRLIRHGKLYVRIPWVPRFRRAGPSAIEGGPPGGANIYFNIVPPHASVESPRRELCTRCAFCNDFPRFGGKRREQPEGKTRHMITPLAYDL